MKKNLKKKCICTHTDIYIYMSLCVYIYLSIYIYLYVCVSVFLNHFAVHLKLTQHGKSTIIQLKINLFICSLFVFRDTPAVYGGSQSRHRIRATLPVYMPYL